MAVKKVSEIILLCRKNIPKWEAWWLNWEAWWLNGLGGVVAQW
jgi:hypothetical protein